MAQARLDERNYEKGFLVDDELLAGISRSEDPALPFIAYVLQHTTGEYLGYEPYPSLEKALQALQRIPRDWTFETFGGCQGTRCAEGKCKGESCRHF
jgi:hypothetical protein